MTSFKHDIRPPRPAAPRPQANPPQPAADRPPTGRSLKRVAMTAFLIVAVAAIGIRAQGQAGPDKALITENVTVARDAFLGARSSLKRGDYQGAADQFAVAERALRRANQSVADYGQVGGLVGAQAGGEVSAGREILSTAELLARSGQRLSADVSGLQNDLAAKGGDPLRLGEVLLDKVGTLQADLEEAERRTKLFGRTVSAAKKDGSLGAYGEQLGEIEQSLPDLEAGIKDANQAVALLPRFLGADRFRQYLIIFQNPAEIRATGGFIGTYGRVTLDSGAVKELKVDSIYNPANQANAAVKEPPPEPFERFIEPGKPVIWGMQDANWSPDFPTTAQKFQQFYEKAEGPTTNGVIGVTTQPIVEVLKVVGPIEMPEYGYTLTPENFQTLLQADQLVRAVQGDQDPKKILRDFTPKLLAKVGQANPEQKQAIFRIAKKAVAARDLTLYFNDEADQALVRRAGADASMLRSPVGTAVIDSNIAGFKSSLDVQSAYEQQVDIARNGTVTVELSVTRRHSAQTSQDVNRNYTRVFVPKGSSLKETSGWLEGTEPKVGEEDGRTVIGGWTDLVPGAERTVKVKYELPGRLDLSDGAVPLQFQKQAGLTPALKVSVTLPDGYAWRRDRPDIDGRTIRFDRPLDYDFNETLAFKRN